MKTLAITTDASNLSPGTGTTPFISGRNCVVTNPTAGSLTLQGSDDGTTYTTLATVATLTYANVTLPNYVKGSAAGLYLLG